jgi:uncharacterized membrane protein YesL
MKFLQYDSPLMSGINKVVDIFWLSMLWFVCCLPIVTIGASTTALYYTAVKSLKKNRAYVTKTFFHAFRLNFFPAMGLWLIFLVGIGLLYCSFLLTSAIEDNSFRFFVSCVYLFLGFLVLGTGCYAFPVLSRCSMGIGANLHFCAGLMVKHFPYTLVMSFVVIITVTVMWYVPLSVFCLPAICSVVYSIFMEKILVKYTPEEEAGAWYLEHQKII